MTGERGSATVLTIALAGALLVGGGAAMAIVESSVRHSRLAHAADAAVLAAATRPGQPDCELAVHIAADYAVSLDRCMADGLDVVVEVSCEAGVLLARAATLAGQPVPRMAVSARAGP